MEVSVHMLQGLVLTLFVLTRPVSADTLFSFDEPIWQLHATNFTVSVHNSETAWIVDFYASWCGHCQQFAPYWVQLARDVEGWSDVVRVAAVNCAEVENTGLCRLYNIYGYPVVKLFPPYASFDYKGHPYSGSKNISSIRTEIVAYLDSMAMTPEAWPKLEPYTSLEDMSSQLSDHQQIYVVMEDLEDDMADPYLGRELILDSLALDGVGVGRMLRSRALSHGVQDFPSFYRLQDGQLLHLASKLDRSGFMEIIRDEAPLQDIKPTITKSTTSSKSTKQITTTTTPVTTPGEVAPSTGVHRHDLDGMIRYALYQEISTHAQISGPAILALKEFIKVLAKYFPGEQHTLLYLRKIRSKLKYKTESDIMTAEEWQRIINTQTDDAYLSPETTWASCAGSEAHFRGYPCSVWMTFHAVTVNAYNIARRNPKKEFHPEEVLVAMREYIRHFFGCRHCAEHFVNMAARVQYDVTNGSDAIMWLWRSHNLVNQRLQGDHTEDPDHPKIQFPDPEGCPQCRMQLRHRYGVTERWREEEVLPYLLDFYSAENIAGGMVTSSAPRLSPTRPSTTTFSPTSPVHTSTLHGTTDTTLQVFKVTFSANRWRPWSGRRQQRVTRRQYRPPGPTRAVPRPTRPALPPRPTRKVPRPTRPALPPRPTRGVPRPTRAVPSPTRVPPRSDRANQEQQEGRSRRMWNPQAAERREWTGKAITVSPTTPGSWTPAPSVERAPSTARSATVAPPYNERRTQSPRFGNWYPPESPFGTNRKRTPAPPIGNRRTPTPSFGNRPTPAPPVSRTLSVAPPSVFVEEPYSSCHLEATDWSECSTSCGTGLSTRMSNYNPGCRMQLEVRLCNLRPCQAVYTQPAVGGCGATYRTYGKQSLRYGECYSTRYTRWRYCGLCEGQCCRPVASDTQWLEMVCYHDYEEVRGYMQVQVIDLCECSQCN